MYDHNFFVLDVIIAMNAVMEAALIPANVWWNIENPIIYAVEVLITHSSILIKCMIYLSIISTYPSYLPIHHIHLSINQLVHCICNHPSSIQVWRYRCVTVILSQFVSVNLINAHKHYDQVFFYIMSCGMNNDEAVVLKVRWWWYMRC